MTNLDNRNSVCDDVFVSQRYLLLSQTEHHRAFLSHIVLKVIVSLKVQAILLEGFQIPGKILVRQSYFLEVTHANIPQPYLYDRYFKNDLNIAIYM
jgi:hypothetical protein